MRLDHFEIDAFGALDGFRAKNLAGQPLVVMVGSNESGKSTFAEFFTTMLFGFSPADRTDHPYAPWSGKPIDGSAGFLGVDGKPFAVSRRLMHAPEGTTERNGETQDIGNRPLPLLGPISRSLYKSFHSLTLDELGDLDDDAWRIVEERLLGGTHLPFLRSPRDAELSLTERCNALWRADGKGVTRHRRIGLALRRLQRERAAAESRLRRMLELREDANGKEWHIQSTREELHHTRARLQRAERLLPVLRALQEIEELRGRANARVPQDELPVDARERLVALRDVVAHKAAKSDSLAIDINEHERRTTLTPEHTAIIAVETDVRSLVGEFAAHQQDQVHINDLTRAHDAQEALFAERASHVFDNSLSSEQRESLSRLGMAELQTRVSAWNDASRQPENEKLEVERSKEAVKVAEADFEALPSVDVERRTRQQEDVLRELQAQEDVLAALRAEMEAARADDSKTRFKKPPRKTMRGVGLIVAGVLLLVTLLTGGSDSWALVGSVAAGLAVAGVLILRQREVEAALPDEQRAKMLARECGKLRESIGLHEYESVPTLIKEAQETLALVAARPELERRLVSARQRLEDCKRRISAGRQGADRARDMVSELVNELPVRQLRLETPGQDLHDDVAELRSLLREMTRLEGERQATRGRAEEREGRAAKLAETLQTLLPGSAMDAVTVWHERLQQALQARRQAEESSVILPELRKQADELRDVLSKSRAELSSFETPLAKLDFEGADVETGLRWLEQARAWRTDADSLERQLHERFPDWAERGEEGKAALAAGETLDLSTEERVELSSRIEQLEAALITLADEKQRVDAECKTLGEQRGLADVDGAIAALEDEQGRIAHQRDRLALVRGIVREADRRYRDRFQSPVLTAASEHLSTITGGKWERIVAERQDDRTRLFIKPFGKDVPVSVGHPLSRGLREQVYFSLRLALADQMDGDEPLPMVLDDVFVDWDERRTQQGFGVLAALGERRQVFVLTSRAEAADRLASAAGAHVLQMPTKKSGKRSARARTAATAPKSKAKSAPKVDAESKPDAKPEAKPVVKPVVKPEPKAKPDEVAKPQKSEADVESKPESKPEPSPKTSPEPVVAGPVSTDQPQPVPTPNAEDTREPRTV